MHGFITLEPNTETIYICSDNYDPSCDSGVRWDDPTIGIDWGLGQDQPILSEKDAAAPCPSQIASPFLHTE
ncbi:dTDP-4-dehydrorhamnose 3,5-epimerase family protein [Yoonia sp. R2331]|uniref:dTDP-4-dehydrorhamnose 3,5-epimerase family protein n=1 Tax=Yoonia sp. R2331 TaxID=3237238 RepID=UPI0034E4CFC9